MAFYWSHRDVCVVLTDDEETQLVRELERGARGEPRGDVPRGDVPPKG